MTHNLIIMLNNILNVEEERGPYMDYIDVYIQLIEHDENAMVEIAATAYKMGDTPEKGAAIVRSTFEELAHQKPPRRRTLTYIAAHGASAGDIVELPYGDSGYTVLGLVVGEADPSKLRDDVLYKRVKKVVAKASDGYNGGGE